MIVPEQHVAASRYDPASGQCKYLIRKDGKCWTVTIPLHELEAKGTVAARRQHLLNAIALEMRNPPHPDPTIVEQAASGDNGGPPLEEA